jgi:hypothetical protein
MKKVFLIAASLLIAGTAAASAHSIDGTQYRQEKRVERGRETGQITWTEGLKLRAEQNKIERKEARFRSDGHLSRSEYRELRRMQGKASRHIAHEKHDGWHRAWWLPRVGY